MHELSIAMSIVETTLEFSEKNFAKTIKEVELQIGTLAGIEFSSFDIALEAAVKGNATENAKFVIHKIQAKAHCKDCGTDFEKQTLFTLCPECKRSAGQLICGKELRIQSILIEK